MMRQLRQLYAHAKGDTIVEVLIVLAVLGGALGFAYGIANKSLLQGQDAQEHTEAVKILEGQIEQLRAVVSQAGSNPSFPSYFCLDANNNPQSIGNPANHSSYPPACVKGQSLFYIYIIPNNPSANTYLATCVWDNVMGTGQDTVTLAYRVYP